MKILLIQPPFTVFKTERRKCHPPLGLAYLAAALKNDHEVRVLDALAEGFNRQDMIDKKHIRYGLSFPDIYKYISSYSPDVVAVSCLFSAQFENVSKVCQAAKSAGAGIITIIGGAHPSSVPHEVLLDRNIDYAVIGEGEITFKELIECLETKKGAESVSGIGFRHNGRIKINPKRESIDDLDKFAFPYWEIFPLDKYNTINDPHGGSLRKVPFLPVITSRGCPFECIFCSIGNFWGRQYRARSAENVLMEIEHLVRKYGIKEILFEDDNLTLDKERCERIFSGIIKKGLDIGWSVPNGIAAQTLDYELMELMKKSGCHSISIGVESADVFLLKNVIKKPISLDGVRGVISAAKKLRLETTVFFVVGLPGEDHGSLKRTFRFAERLDADNVNFFFATPLPGTRLLELCMQKGLVKDIPDYADLKSNYPNFATETFSVHALRSAVSAERLKIIFLTLIRHPLKFARKLFGKTQKRVINIFAMGTRRGENADNMIYTTGRRYSFLWSRYKNSPPPFNYHFNQMQETIREEIVTGKIGLEVGCGCGWDAYLMAKSNPAVRIIAIDISDGIYNAQRLSRDLANMNILKGSALGIPLKSGICDFVYSFGVLHHTGDSKKGLSEITRVLRKGRPCYLYLYEDHYENRVKYVFIKIVTYLRRLTVHVPPKILYKICVILSPVVYIFFSLPAKIFKRFGLTRPIAEKMPFNFAQGLFSLRGDLYDRFSAPIEQRFNRRDVYGMFQDCGFSNIRIGRLKGISGWVAWGYKA